MDDWKPKGTADVKGEYIDDYPNNAKEGHWWLLGTSEDDSAHYLDDRSRQVIRARQQEEGGFEVLETESIRDDQPVSHYVDVKRTTDESWDTWSRYSWPFYTASGIRAASGRLLTQEQAVVFSFRAVWDVPRKDTAAVLGKSPNTVDNQLSNAQQKAEWAEGLTERLNTLKDYAPTYTG